MPYKNPEDRKAQRKRYYEAHRSEEIQRALAWKKKNPLKNRLNNLRYKQKKVSKAPVSKDVKHWERLIV